MGRKPRRKFEVIEDVPFGYCGCACGQKTNVHRNTCRRTGAVRGQPHRFLPHHFPSAVKKSVFDVEWLRSEQAAWFLGLWMADGHLTSGGFLSLSSTDHDAVRKAASCIGLGEDWLFVNPGKRGTTAKSSLNFKVKIARHLPALLAVGIAPGPKTGREVVPLGFQNNRHFWRGLVEGDGWITTSGQKSAKTVGFGSACEQLVRSFVDFCCLSDPEGRIPPIKNRGPSEIGTQDYFVVQVTGDMAETVVRVLYEGCTIFMDRKKCKAEELIRQAEAQRAKQLEVLEAARDLDLRIDELYTAQGLGHREISARLGVTSKRVYDALRVLGRRRQTNTGNRSASKRTHCANGHPWISENLSTERTGTQRCKICHKECSRKSKATKKD